MRVFVDYFCDFVILNVLQVVEGLFIILFRQVVHDNHLEVVLLVSEVYQVLNPPMGLHYQVHQLLVYHVQIRIKDFLQLFLLFLEFSFYLY